MVRVVFEARDLAKRLMLTDLSERPVLQGRTEEELLSFISPQLAAREEYYLKADHVVDAPGFTEDADEQLVDSILAMFKDSMI